MFQFVKEKSSTEDQKDNFFGQSVFTNQQNSNQSFEHSQNHRNFRTTGNTLPSVFSNAQQNNNFNGGSFRNQFMQRQEARGIKRAWQPTLEDNFARKRAKLMQVTFLVHVSGTSLLVEKIAPLAEAQNSQTEIFFSSPAWER